MGNDYYDDPMYVDRRIFLGSRRKLPKKFWFIAIVWFLGVVTWLGLLISRVAVGMTGGSAYDAKLIFWLMVVPFSAIIIIWPSKRRKP